MSQAIDLVSVHLVDTHLGTLGTPVGDLVQLDLTSVAADVLPIPLPTSATLSVGAVGNTDPQDQETVWVEADLLKSPPNIITRGECGLSRKQYNYVIFIKSPKNGGRYYNQLISDVIEEHFPNNLHLQHNDYLLTVLKSYQQSSIFLDANTGRYWNRIFVECEVFYNNLN